MCIRDLLSFFTAFPVKGRGLGFECLWALPYVVAPIVGGVGGLAYALTGDARLAYLALLLATGLNHVDGLADVADALMVRDKERAKAVLEDPRKGAVAIFAVVAIVFLGMSASPGSWLHYIAAEVFSKSLAVVAAGFSRPFKPGLGAEFVKHARRQWPTALPAMAATAWFSPMRFSAALVASLLFYVAAYRHLGGTNGDLLGALLEVSRVAYLY